MDKFFYQQTYGNALMSASVFFCVKIHFISFTNSAKQMDFTHIIANENLLQQTLQQCGKGFFRNNEAANRHPH